MGEIDTEAAIPIPKNIIRFLREFRKALDKSIVSPEYLKAFIANQDDGMAQKLQGEMLLAKTLERALNLANKMKEHLSTTIALYIGDTPPENEIDHYAFLLYFGLTRRDVSEYYESIPSSEKTTIHLDYFEDVMKHQTRNLIPVLLEREGLDKRTAEAIADGKDYLEPVLSCPQSVGYLCGEQFVMSFFAQKVEELMETEALHTKKISPVGEQPKPRRGMQIRRKKRVPLVSVH